MYIYINRVFSLLKSRYRLLVTSINPHFGLEGEGVPTEEVTRDVSVQSCILRQ